MMRRCEPGRLVLAVHPNRRGFGWAAFEGPFTLYDFGTTYIERDKNAGSLRRLDTMVAMLQPRVLILEAFEAPARRSGRVTRLCQGIVALAASRGVEVAIYAKGAVQACFRSVGAVTRRGIAESVSRMLEPLRDQVPGPRRAWQCEHPKMTLFAAAALGLTHFQLSSSQIVEELA